VWCKRAPSRAAPPNACVAVALGDALRRVAARVPLGGRDSEPEGMPRSLGSVYVGAVALFLSGGQLVERLGGVARRRIVRLYWQCVHRQEPTFSELQAPTASRRRAPIVLVTLRNWRAPYSGSKSAAQIPASAQQCRPKYHTVLVLQCVATPASREGLRSTARITVKAGRTGVDLAGRGSAGPSLPHPLMLYCDTRVKDRVRT
jgi:hypothetical protein